jgi:D-3-phosphoglycerate dehydrogenase
VLVYDPITAIDWDYELERAALSARGVHLDIPVGRDEARAALPRADVAVVSSSLPAEDLSLLRRGSAILCYSVGMDGVDAVRARELGIGVHNVPDYCTEEVSDHAIALLLALQRNLVPVVSASATGDWTRAYMALDAQRPRRVRGQVAGVLGVGRIGTRVAQKCDALGMTVLGYDPWATVTRPAKAVELDTLLTESDVVLICAALTSTSRHLIDAAALGQMKPGSLLINVARGGLVDEQALASALRAGRLRGAALDVRVQEPPDPANDPLAGLASVILTPHMAATSVEARHELHVRAVEVLLGILDTLEHGRASR